MKGNMKGDMKGDISERRTIEPIGHIETDLPTKFGLPRQSGLVPALTGRVIFRPKYRDPVAFRGLEGFSHIWLIWGFSENSRDAWAATVKPPRLGGNRRMGVFATRSPYRPNALGLSCVELKRLDLDEKLGPVLVVAGLDLMDGTPIYDVKPYLPYTDSRPDAAGGFATCWTTPWRSTFPRRSWPVSRPTSGTPCWVFWPRTPARPTSTTRPGGTGSTISHTTCALPWTAIP